jgi:uncharacterized membrane protein YgaE (UPF0421/DUF939 family)
MIWKLFSSDRRVTAALEQYQGIGYDISPRILPQPANDEESETAGLELQLWTDHAVETDDAHANASDFWERAVYSR